MCDVIVKVGGGLLADASQLDDTLAALATLARIRHVLVVPGGGPFADAVRLVDRRLGIDDDAAHWMAILAMDQFAHLLAARLERAALVRDRDEARGAIATGATPVLAPYRWLKAADPLPHRWDVTSDSIAAWIAGACGARELVLVKPAGATGALVDGSFDAVRPPDVAATIVPADRVRDVFAQIGRAENAARPATVSPGG